MKGCHHTINTPALFKLPWRRLPPLHKQAPALLFEFPSQLPWRSLMASSLTASMASSSLSELLSEVASDSLSRKEFHHHLRTIAHVVSRPDWDPNSRTSLQPFGLQLTPSHVAHLLPQVPHPAWALRIFIWAARQPGYKHDAIARREIVKLWQHNQLFEPFLDVLEHVGDSEYDMTPESYNLLMKGYGWAEMVDVALLTLERMQKSGFTPDVSHFNSLLYILVRANRLKTIRQLYQQMLDSGITPNAVTHALLVRGYCAAGQFDEASKAFFAMLKKSLAPDLRTFGELIACMCKANRTYRIYQILCEMQDNRFTPDQGVYYALLEGLCRNDYVKVAEKLVNELSEHGVEKTATVYNILAKGLCRERKVHNAHVVVNEMLKKGFLPEPDVFNLVIILLFKEGKVGQAFRFVDHLIDRGFLPNISTYNILIYGLSKYGEVGKALEAWDILLQFCLPSVKSYRALLKGLCKAGRLNEAKEVFKTTMEKGGTGDEAVHATLLYRLKQAGKFTDVKECNSIMDARNHASGGGFNIFQGIQGISREVGLLQGSDVDEETDSSSDESNSDDDTS